MCMCRHHHVKSMHAQQHPWCAHSLPHTITLVRGRRHSLTETTQNLHPKSLFMQGPQQKHTFMDGARMHAGHWGQRPFSCKGTVSAAVTKAEGET